MYTRKIWLMPPSAPLSEQNVDVWIPHGDYIPWLQSLGVNVETIRAANVHRCSDDTTRLLAFGVIKRYKCLDEAVRAVAGASDVNLRLTIKGNAPDSDYLGELLSIAAGDSRIVIAPGRMDDLELAREILSADLIVLPYRDLYNSGALLLALSLGRPVAMRRSEVALQMFEEFGPEWIFLYEGEFTADVAVKLVQSVGRTAVARKSSPGRDWARVARLHNEAYCAASVRSTEVMHGNRGISEKTADHQEELRDA
jgi:beta-1,4-mannosyltransferase